MEGEERIAWSQTTKGVREGPRTCAISLKAMIMTKQMTGDGGEECLARVERSERRGREATLRNETNGFGRRERKKGDHESS